MQTVKKSLLEKEIVNVKMEIHFSAFKPTSLCNSADYILPQAGPRIGQTHHCQHSPSISSKQFTTRRACKGAFLSSGLLPTASCRTSAGDARVPPKCPSSIFGAHCASIVCTSISLQASLVQTDLRGLSFCLAPPPHRQRSHIGGRARWPLGRGSPRRCAPGCRRSAPMRARLTRRTSAAAARAASDSTCPCMHAYGFRVKRSFTVGLDNGKILCSPLPLFWIKNKKSNYFLIILKVLAVLQVCHTNLRTKPFARTQNPGRASLMQVCFCSTAKQHRRNED